MVVSYTNFGEARTVATLLKDWENATSAFC